MVSCKQEQKKFFLFSEFLTRNSTDKAIIISCVRCSCVIDDINSIELNNQKLLHEYLIIGDSSCLKSLKVKNKIIHVPQIKLDSLSTDLYNVLIIKRVNGDYQTKMIKTEESANMEYYLK